jgi:hypothetical protein
MVEEENPYGGTTEEIQGDISMLNQDSTNLMNDIEFDFSVTNPHDNGQHIVYMTKGKDK